MELNSKSPHIVNNHIRDYPNHWDSQLNNQQMGDLTDLLINIKYLE